MSRTAVAFVVLGLAWSIPSRADMPPPPPSCTGQGARAACATGDVGKACATGGVCLATFCLGDDGGTMTLPQCVLGVDAGPGTSDAAKCTLQHPCGTDGTGCDLAGNGSGSFALCLLLAALAVSRFDRRGGSAHGAIMGRWQSRTSRPNPSAPDIG